MATEAHGETEDRKFSQTFADLLAPILRALELGEVEVRDKQIVIRAEESRVVYLDVRAVVLQGRVRMRRPKRRRLKRGQLEVVK